MSVVICGKTAQLYYRTVMSLQDYPSFSLGDEGAPDVSPPTRAQVDFALRLLYIAGIGEEELEKIHVAVQSASERRVLKGVECHVDCGALTNGRIVVLAKDIYIVDIAACAVEAAEFLSFVELAEYYYELCGSYGLPLEDERPYLERRPLLTVEVLRAYLHRSKGMRGAKLATKALKYVRDGSRSPMETVLIMLLVMPKRDGGLGIRDIEMDYCLQVRGYATKLTVHRYFFFDMYIPRAKLDIEYDGIIHEEEEREADDNDRRNALKAMGYDLMRVNRKNLMKADPFKRTMASIYRDAGLYPSHFPSDFEWKQEELRKFLLRRMLRDEF